MGNTLVTGLLTGGGFAALVTLMGYLFTINKNKADAATIVSEGAARVVTMLENRLEKTEAERDALKAWARRKHKADAAHSVWDKRFADKFDRLLAECNQHGIATDVAPLDDPPSLDVPFNGDL